MGFDVSTLQTFFGPPAATFVSSGAPVVGTDIGVVPASGQWRNTANLTRLSPGAMVANTYKTAILITGAGNVKFLAAETADPTTRDMGLRVTIDGVVVYERVVTGIGGFAGKVLPAIGSVGYLGTQPATASDITFGDARFNKSLLVELRSSLTETNGVYALANYILT